MHLKKLSTSGSGSKKIKLVVEPIKDLVEDPNSKICLSRSEFGELVAQLDHARRIIENAILVKKWDVWNRLLYSKKLKSIEKKLVKFVTYRIPVLSFRQTMRDTVVMTDIKRMLIRLKKKDIKEEGDTDSSMYYSTADDMSSSSSSSSDSLFSLDDAIMKVQNKGFCF